MKTNFKCALSVCFGLLVSHSFAQTNTNVGNTSGNGGSGAHNSFYGYASGQSNSTGSNNTFLGASSGLSNSVGNKNVFVGWYSGNANVNGYNNVFLGSKAGKSNVSGFRNTYLGPGAGLSNSSGYQNTAVGYLAGKTNQLGLGNVFMGALAGYSNTGSYNVFLGFQAGYYETGSDKLYIDNTNTQTPLIYGDFALNQLTVNGGLDVEGDLSAEDIDGSSLVLRSTAGLNFHLKEEMVSGCVSNRWHFQVGRTCGVGPLPPGPFSILTLDYTGDATSVGVGIENPQYKLDVNGKVRATQYLTFSDKRLKKDVQPLRNASELLSQLEGVTYTYRQDLKDEGRNLADGKQIGFIAQEVQKVIPEIVEKDEEGYLSVSYQSLIPLLVENQKELQSQNDELKAANEKLEQEIEAIKAMLAKLAEDVPSQSVQLENVTGEMLMQNAPNPFSESTSIEYNLPSDCQETQLIILDSKGTIIKTIDQLESGRGKVVLQANSLAPGTYRYALVCEGRTLEVKTMVIVK